ncbi:MAG: restriction endonuclease subunit S [Gammaproteobacteria bacterium]|nr:restriction endonuclease subunit S [Gammaproteobacteria bacterium]
MDNAELSTSHYPLMKDSGVEWTGEIPAEWEVKKLKYVAQVNPLKDNLDQISDELVTFLSMDSISENGTADCSIKKPVSSVCDGFTFFRRNDVIVAKITPCFENGKCVFLSNLDTSIGFGSTEFHVLRPKERIVGKFLYYITKSEIFMQSGEAFMYGAAGQKRVPSSFISDFPLVLPDADEQTAIANFLDRKTAEIDALIAQKQRLLELYEEEKTAIINHAVTKGIDPNAELKDSGVEWLGEIPVGWEVRKLKYVAQVNPLKDNLDQTSDELVTFLPMDSISENGTADCSIKKPVSSVCDGFTFFRRNDVIVAKITPCFENGKCVFLSNLDTSIGFGSTEFHVLRPKERIVGKFLYYITKSEIFMQSGEAFMYGAAGQKRVPSSFISDFPLVLPDADEQTAIVNFLNRKTTEINAKITKTQRIIELQKEYRTALISEAVTGKIKVPELPTQEASA